MSADDIAHSTFMSMYRFPVVHSSNSTSFGLHRGADQDLKGAAEIIESIVGENTQNLL